MVEGSEIGACGGSLSEGPGRHCGVQAAQALLWSPGPSNAKALRAVGGQLCRRQDGNFDHAGRTCRRSRGCRRGIRHGTCPRVFSPP
eukprot:scaffold6677_cov49-Phaeocystis_antarctica.AAC.5